MKVFVVIVTYNGEKWIQKCLKSIINATIIPEIIVVDNNSTDKTVDLIENFPASIQLLKQTNNLGFGQANNLGMSYALKNECDFVFLLNQDAYFQKNTLQILLEVYTKNDDYGLLSPIHLNGKGDKLDKNFSNYISYNSNHFIFKDALTLRLKEVYNVDFVNAAAWLLPKKTLENIGGFDPLFFHYGEDDNYCQRLKYHNFKIGVVPNSFVYHDREFENKRVIHGFKEELDRRILITKSRLANINLENTIKTDSKKILKNALIKIYLFQFNKFLKKIIEWRALQKIKNNIANSRQKNVFLNNNYL